MKIKGKIKDLEDILRRSGCDGLFDPVTFELKEDMILVKMQEEGDIGAMLGKFTSLTVEGIDEDSEEFVVNTKNLMDDIAVISSEKDFEAVEEEGRLKIEVDNETVFFNMDSDWAKNTLPVDEIPIKAEEDGKYFQEKELTAGVKINSAELSKVIGRMDTVEVDFTKLEIEDGKFKTTIGDLIEEKYNPRIFKPNAKVMDSEESESTEIGFGFRKIVNVISGEVELYFSESSPIAVYDEDEDYRTVYLLSSVEKEK